MAKLLVEEDNIKGIVMCPSLNINYVYVEEEGFYEQVSPPCVERIINDTLEKEKVYLEMSPIKKIYSQLTLIKGVPEKFIQRQRYICFSNGLLKID